MENLVRLVSFRLLLIPIPILAVSSLAAQDTRMVTEPTIPPESIKLDADIASTNGQIALADEQKLSTARI